MISRRSFLHSGFLVTSYWSGFREAALSSYHRQKFGVLLGTVEHQMTLEPAATLQKIAAMGFSELEYPRTYGLTAGQLRKNIRRYRLTSLGGGNTIKELTEHFNEYVAEYHAMGKSFVFCYWPWFDGGKNKTAEDWKRNAELLNQLGYRFKSAGLRFGYHNHDIEFFPVADELPYEILLRYTDPEALTFQMDIWWIRKGLQDPLRFIRNYPGRFEVCHVKPAGILANTETEYELHFKNTMQALQKNGCRHFILENEPGISDPFHYFQKSIALMQQWL